ncbi:hypothetical protein TCON_1888 [Astathelohania contejeani]|uniref:Uncharacterized protein n=1 Tax=Astathelohania contejeani TaxID=164912 RepID=A0ABQ7HXL0_9MICR|nr:hypothetical protein TCON_1888 [Thelohania contejeani]
MRYSHMAVKSNPTHEESTMPSCINIEMLNIIDTYTNMINGEQVFKMILKNGKWHHEKLLKLLISENFIGKITNADDIIKKRSEKMIEEIKKMVILSNQLVDVDDHPIKKSVLNYTTSIIKEIINKRNKKSIKIIDDHLNNLKIIISSMIERVESHTQIKLFPDLAETLVHKFVIKFVLENINNMSQDIHIFETLINEDQYKVVDHLKAIIESPENDKPITSQLSAINLQEIINAYYNMNNRFINQLKKSIDDFKNELDKSVQHGLKMAKVPHSKDFQHDLNKLYKDMEGLIAKGMTDINDILYDKENLNLIKETVKKSNDVLCCFIERYVYNLNKKAFDILKETVIGTIQELYHTYETD